MEPIRAELRRIAIVLAKEEIAKIRVTATTAEIRVGATTVKVRVRATVMWVPTAKMDGNLVATTG